MMKKAIFFLVVFTMVLGIQVSHADQIIDSDWLEWNIDRPGSDYKSFGLPVANPLLCRDACAGDPECEAWTYVKPGYQCPDARCWLKHSVPSAVSSNRCVSGVSRPGYMEWDIDRPGSDYKSFDLPVANPLLCRDACAGDPECEAWTYVKPGYQCPDARCWLKHSVPSAVSSNPCISGVK